MKDYNGVIKANTYVKIRDEEHLEVVKAEMWKVYNNVDEYDHCLKVGSYITFRSILDGVGWGSYSKFINLPDSFSGRYTEIFIEAPATKPTPPFKIRNGNDPAVRQWLVDNGWDYPTSSILTCNWNSHHLYVKGDGELTHNYNYEKYFNNHPYPELNLNISNITREVVTTITEPQVTSWNMVDSEKSERMELIAKIEAGLAELKKLG